MSLSYQGRAPVLRDEEDPNRRLMLVHEHNPGGMQRTAERVTTNTTVYYGDRVRCVSGECLQHPYLRTHCCDTRN